VLATFLTWMQEKEAPVFVFATANAVSRLPPELLRKGRFDELFFLDLPTASEREQILEVHLRRKGMTMIRQHFDLRRISQATEGFVGAELEAVVNEAMFPAFLDSRREVETEDLLKAAGDMVPLARSHREHIENMRQLVVSGEARNASRASCCATSCGWCRPWTTRASCTSTASSRPAASCSPSWSWCRAAP
jgi:SpoVK/Ycf46/Vps4 family AAA+-type ATPase